MIKAIAWDIDGTLIDSEPTHHLALVHVSARYNVEIALDDTRFVGVAMENVWKELHNLFPQDLGYETWLAQIVEEYVRLSPRLVAITGACEAISALSKDHGLAQCAVSNSVRRIVDANLAAIGVTDFMAFTIARDDVEKGKPDPEPYKLTCERLGLTADQVLAVEDSDTGVAAAKAAGMLVLKFGADFTDFADFVSRVTKTRMVS
nr:HAD family phosphatase [uncultured Cohaesibacter sp.]